MNILNQVAIDVHAHLGAYRRLGHALVDEFGSGDAAYVIRRASVARTRLTIVSPLEALLPRGAADVLAGNQLGLEAVTPHAELRMWAVLSPLVRDSWAQVAALLQHPKCVGIKIHPEEHVYPFPDHGRRIFEFAAAHGVGILTHSGERNSLPADIVTVANEFPGVSVILAHLGCGWDNDPTLQVRAVQSARHNNVFIDTSSARNVMPHLVEWAVAEIGSDKLLFGTDSPLYDAPMQRARIDYADIPDSDKQAILSGTAMKLLGSKLSEKG